MKNIIVFGFYFYFSDVVKVVFLDMIWSVVVTNFYARTCMVSAPVFVFMSVCHCVIFTIREVIDCSFADMFFCPAATEREIY